MEGQRRCKCKSCIQWWWLESDSLDLISFCSFWYSGVRKASYGIRASLLWELDRSRWRKMFPAYKRQNTLCLVSLSFKSQKLLKISSFQMPLCVCPSHHLCFGVICSQHRAQFPHLAPILRSVPTTKRVWPKQALEGQLVRCPFLLCFRKSMLHHWVESLRFLPLLGGRIWGTPQGAKSRFTDKWKLCG